jgi:Spy/CpxP family protein refolding chaperone
MLRDGSKKEYTHFFQCMILLLIFSFLASFCIRTSEAQSNGPSLKTRNGRGLSQSLLADLTEEQTKAIESLQHTYLSKVFPLRRELISSRFELRHLIRDPNVQPKTLLDLQKRMSELQARLDHLSLSYQIEVRTILTKEQLEQLPQDCSLGISPEYDVLTGIGRAPRRGLR